MKVTLIDEPNSDLKVVNAARVSFDKRSEWKTCIAHGESCNEGKELSDKDIKLIQYLANHNHWTPFAHCQEAFELRLEMLEELRFFRNANLSGFEWVKGVYEDGYTRIRGSLYAWLTNLDYLPKIIADPIANKLLKKYPVSTLALMEFKDYKIAWLSNSYVTPIENACDLALFDELLTYTLLIEVPIFVKRQLETHRRNFVITDIEDFSQNEVSRRYVDSEPKIYYPSQWRIQSENKKQGSSDEVMDENSAYLINSNYNHTVYLALFDYRNMNKRNIAHEQSRMVLPLSTYTSFWWTGSLRSYKRMIQLRDNSHAQNETRDVAQMIKEAIGI